MISEKALEAYYSAERDLPVISHEDFSIDPVEVVEVDDSLKLIRYLETVEDRYLERLVRRRFSNVSDPTIVNELMVMCIKKFSDLSIMTIFDGITSFFVLDAKEAYAVLDTELKRELYKKLSEKIEIKSYEKIKVKSEAEKNNGFVQIGFKRHQ